MFNWSQEQALQLVMFHIATQSEITSFFRGVFLSPVNVFSCPLSLASKSRDCVTTEINTGARGSSGSTCLTEISTDFELHKCVLHETHRLIKRLLCSHSIENSLSVKGNNSSSLLCGEETNFIVFEIIITTVCAVTSCEKLTTD